MTPAGGGPAGAINHPNWVGGVGQAGANHSG